MSFKSNVLWCALLLWVIWFTSVKGGSFQLNLQKNQKFSAEVDASYEEIDNERIMWLQELKHLRKHIKDCVQVRTRVRKEAKNAFNLHNI